MEKKTKKKKVTEVKDTLALPTGATVEVNDRLVVKGNGKVYPIVFAPNVVKVKVDNNIVEFAVIGKPSRSKVAAMRSTIAHIKNAFIGMSTGFSKKLQVVFAHFPVTIEVKGKDIFIKNFLGEKLARSAKIIGDTKVEVKGQEITITGSDKYSVGQTANNLMRATKIRKKDRRVFQDGIYPNELK